MEEERGAREGRIKYYGSPPQIVGSLFDPDRPGYYKGEKARKREGEHNGGVGMGIWWIFKRTLLRLASILGALLLLAMGLSSCMAGANHNSTGLTILGIALVIGGILLAMFYKALNKWIELK